VNRVGGISREFFSRLKIPERKGQCAQESASFSHLIRLVFLGRCEEGDRRCEE
jgi:hypothetical protein